MAEYGEGTVITSTGLVGPVFIPMTRWIPATTVLQIRATVEMRGNSGNAAIAAGYQTSNDQVNLDAAAFVGNYLTSEGFLYPTGYMDVSAATAGRQFVRFGLMCQSVTRGIVQSCWGAVSVEILPQYLNLVSSAGRITASGAVTNYIACETANNNGSGIIGAGCNFAKNFPSNPSSITIANQLNGGVNNTGNTWNLQVGGVGIYHGVTASGNVYFYETVTAS